METPVQDTPPAQPRMYTTPTSQPPFMSDAMHYSSMGGTSMPMSMRPNSPEMPTILETNSQASPDNHMHQPGHHQAPQSSWNPTHSWIPATSMGQSPPPPVGSLTGSLSCVMLSACLLGLFAHDECLCQRKAITLSTYRATALSSWQDWYNPIQTTERLAHA